jgi:uncharacterized protein (DUF1684 family)
LEADVIRLAPILILVLVVPACTPSKPALSWSDQLLADRVAKDRAFREDSSSPLLAENVGSFKGLSYFPPDESYRVPASLRVWAEDATRSVKMPTSTGQIRDMIRVGQLEFELKGQPLKLSAFVEAGEGLDRLFVPFTDLTTGTETYAGGRYLDLARTPTGIYVIDFNRAYHPYCFFNPKYDCPYPPRENRLLIPVRAGERLPLT